jgi:hypothetical protein
MRRPEWWGWELELTFHVDFRLAERGLTEIVLRRMLERATSLRFGQVPGRFEVTGRFQGQRWTIVLEPDFETRVIVVITIFPDET